MVGQDCVVDIETIRSEESVVDRFVTYGRITGLYPWRPDRSSRQHYFIRYAHPDCVVQACQDTHPDFDAVALTSGQLVDRYVALAMRNGTMNPSASSSSIASTAPSNHATSPASKNRKARRADARSQPQPAIQTDQISNPALRSLPTPPVSALDRTLSPGIPSLHLLPAFSEIALSTRTEDDEDKENDELVVTQLGTPFASESPACAVPLLISLSTPAPSQPLSLAPPSMPSVQTTIVMSLCGQPISFDLTTLNEDPEAIISLLKATASDRDKWMIVGACYRRLGNVAAAETVAKTMIEVMKEFGIAEIDLKPAFLMLSSCQTELGKRARTADGKETEVSLAHLDSSRRWLQRVYGTNTPESSTPKAPSGGALELMYTANVADPLNTPRSDQQVLPTAATELLPPVRIRSLDRPASAIPAASSTHASMTMQATSPAKTPAEPLDRDLQVLRDRQAIHVAELKAARGAKRALEDECAHERTQRRKLERALYDLEAQLAKAQRMEDDAREQVRREVHERRKAEELAMHERAMRIEAEERGKKDVRPILESLAGMFQRAALQGDVSALSVMASASRGATSSGL